MSAISSSGLKLHQQRFIISDQTFCGRLIKRLESDFIFLQRQSFRVNFNGFPIPGSSEYAITPFANFEVHHVVKIILTIYHVSKDGGEFLDQVFTVSQESFTQSLDVSLILVEIRQQEDILFVNMTCLPFLAAPMKVGNSCIKYLRSHRASKASFTQTVDVSLILVEIRQQEGSLFINLTCLKFLAASRMMGNTGSSI
ncbi:hypothetical protein AVEN_273953-1 [Araneus ventricosus]|uniref:Uncharacterized protein n=1 Tax=Araneus ventricosus TaxID=182803 RepID=A0A4Y2Q7Y8_ARAVE|nr:hypothetical protein AVEN_273953-1 [Araneus ventricosus]